MFAASFVIALAGFATSIHAFNASSKNNVAIYWGQGPNQNSLVQTCMNANIDIINLAFVNVFPDQGAGGWPGDNFGNQCGSEVYQHNGVNTSLLSNCPSIGPAITTCQQTYGKKILLSLGGSYPANGYLKSTGSAQFFAQFLWSAFGPLVASNSSIPRPFGNAVVDGFDFDIETYVNPAPEPNYQSYGYAAMVNYFKNTLFPQDKTKSYYLSASPQCPVPDVHLSTAIANAWFDFVWIQFYNTPGCSARDGIAHLDGHGTTDISYNAWTQSSSLNPNVKMYIGLPASTAAVVNQSYYLPPAQVQQLVNEFYVPKQRFGGIMLWEATFSHNNQICGMAYATWMKKVLNSTATGVPLNPNPATCQSTSPSVEHVSRRLIPRFLWS